MFKLNQPIKILVHVGYGGYGFNIPELIVNRIKESHGGPYADEMFYYSYGQFSLVNYDDESRFNPVLIDAFEWLNEFEDSEEFNKIKPAHYNNKYSVKKINLNLDIESFDGKESDVKIIGRAY